MKCGKWVRLVGIEGNQDIGLMSAAKHASDANWTGVKDMAG